MLSCDCSVSKLRFGDQNAGLLTRIMLALVLSWSMAASNAAAADDPLRVVTIGTSLTARGGWQQVLEEALAACMAREVSVDIAAKVGANSGWGLSTIDHAAAQKPHLVVIEFAINDADWWDGVSREQTRLNMASMIRALRRANPKIRIILASMNPVIGWRALLRPQLSFYYADLTAIAAEEGVEMLDLEKRWLALPKAELEQGLPDGVHPKEELARKIIVPALTQTIGGPDCADKP